MRKHLSLLQSFLKRGWTQRYFMMIDLVIILSILEHK